MALAVLGGVAAGTGSRRGKARAGAAGAGAGAEAAAEAGAGVEAGSLVRGALPPRELALLPPDARVLPPLPELLLLFLQPK